MLNFDSFTHRERVISNWASARCESLLRVREGGSRRFPPAAQEEPLFPEEEMTQWRVKFAFPRVPGHRYYLAPAALIAVVYQNRPAALPDQHATASSRQRPRQLFARRCKQVFLF